MFGRASRNRTYVNGFGDRCTTIVLWLYDFMRALMYRGTLKSQGIVAKGGFFCKNTSNENLI